MKAFIYFNSRITIKYEVVSLKFGPPFFSNLNASFWVKINGFSEVLVFKNTRTLKHHLLCDRGNIFLMLNQLITCVMFPLAKMMATCCYSKTSEVLITAAGINIIWTRMFSKTTS